MSAAQSHEADVEALLALVCHSFGVGRAEPESRSDELGPNSEQVLKLVAALEERFGVGIDLVDVFTADTVADLTKLTRS